MVKKIGSVLIILLLGSVMLEAQNIRLQLSQLINKVFADEDARAKVIKMSAMNKMLSQQMAKDVTLISHNINPDYYYRDLLDSAKKFNDFIDGMYKGNASLKLKKATDKNVIKELNEVNAVWKNFHKAVLIVYKSGKIDKNAYKYIIDNNEKLLRLSHKLTQTLQSKNIINTHDNQVIVHTLKFADRQRMLTQKMFKEKFLVYTKENAKRNNVRLRGSLILFKNGLVGLINGDNKRGLAKVTSKPIQEKLKQMYELYSEAEAIYAKQNVDLEKLKHLTEIDKQLSRLSIEVVDMIEKTLVY